MVFGHEYPNCLEQTHCLRDPSYMNSIFNEAKRFLQLVTVIEN